MTEGTEDGFPGAELNSSGDIRHVTKCGGLSRDLFPVTLWTGQGTELGVISRKYPGAYLNEV